MEKTTNKNLLVLNLVLAILAGVFLLSLLDSWKWWFKLAAFGIIVFSQVSAVLLYLWKQNALFRLIQSISFIIFIGFYGFAILEHYGVFERISNPEALRELIRSTGIWGAIIYIGLQIVQVVLLPIPSVILDLVGVALFGSVKAFFLTLTGVMIGSILAFLFGKLFGKKLAVWIAGKEDAERYRKLIGKKGYLVLAAMFVLPLFPDDLLCILAGLTSITFGQFFLLLILTRPIGIAFVCFFGSGEIIPFHGWGLAVWIILFALIIIGIILANIYKDRLKKLFKRLTSKKKETNQKKSEAVEKKSPKPEVKTKKRAKTHSSNTIRPKL